MKYRVQRLALLVLACAFFPQPAGATDGYFSLGYGLKAEGLGGAAIALTNDAKGGANNPASMVWVGNRFDIGFEEFNPTRSASRTGNSKGLNGAVASEQNAFIIPGLGFNHMLGSRSALGVTVYGNGGLNTDYASGQLNCGGGPGTGNLLCGPGRLGINLVQLIVAPTLSYKIGTNASVGLSPLFVHQAFRAGGLQAFTAVSSAPSSVTDNGQAASNGIGYRIGFLGKISPMLNAGITYSPRVHMGSFTAYKGLFANGGSFDIPANFVAGIAIDPNGKVTLAADYERIEYGGVLSIANPSTNMAPLGAVGGPGFGWQSISVERVGVEYHASARTVLRVGYNHGQNPVQARDVTFNIIAPGVVTDHLTFGTTQSIGTHGEVTFAYTRGLPNAVSGATSPLLPGGGVDTIHLAENSFGLGYGRRF